MSEHRPPISLPATQPAALPAGHPQLPLTAKALKERKPRAPLERTAPELSAAAVLMQFGYGEEPGSDVEMILEIQKMHARLNAGDLSHAENMLMSQAVALQGIFSYLASVAKSELKGKNGNQGLQSLISLALRAQSGSRATLQALGDLKFPRQATFVKQANIANGNQQVNNAVSTSRTEMADRVSTNELSGHPNELLPDSRASSTPITGNPKLATVGKVNRAKVGRGQGEGGAKRD